MKAEALDAGNSQTGEVVRAPSAAGKSLRGREVAAWLFRASSLLYVLSRFIPCQPPRRVGLIEESYIPTLHQAFVEHWQFGRDIIFTFGPWGFLYGGFHPSTHAISVCAWAILSLIFWWAAWRAARTCFEHDFGAWLWVLGFTALADVTVFLNLDARLTGLLLLLWLNHFRPGGARSTITEVSLVLAIAWLSLVKFSMLVSGSMVLLVIGADTICRGRRFPWLWIVFGLGLLVFWALAGQRISSLPPFIRASCLITSGYTDGMSLELSDDVKDVWWFAGLAMLLTLTAGYALWRQSRFWSLLPLSALGALEFSAFKYGYVRHDGHEVAATMQLSLVALVILAMASRLIPRKGVHGLLALLLPGVLVLCFTVTTFNHYAENGFFGMICNTFGLRNVSAPFGLLRGNEELVKARENFFAAVRQHLPLPRLDGTTDEYSCHQVTLFANGLRYHPRPVIQSYSAYTAALAELNAASLRGDSGPDNIIFEPQPIDDHFPALEDGACWPELLVRYDIAVSHTNGMLILKRAPKPRSYEKILIEEQAISFGTPVSVPAVAEGPIWAEIDIKKSLWGKGFSAFYKAPELALTVALRNGEARKFRLIPGMARAGFIISPFVGNAESFGLLASREGFEILSSMEVRALTITAGKDGKSACYEGSISIRFYRLHYPMLDSKSQSLP